MTCYPHLSPQIRNIVIIWFLRNLTLKLQPVTFISPLFYRHLFWKHKIAGYFAYLSLCGLKSNIIQFTSSKKSTAKLLKLLKAFANKGKIKTKY